MRCGNALAAAMVLLALSAAHAQPRDPSTPPALGYQCPMRCEPPSAHPGHCAVCGMPLAAIHIATVLPAEASAASELAAASTSTHLRLRPLEPIAAPPAGTPARLFVIAPDLSDYALAPASWTADGAVEARLRLGDGPAPILFAQTEPTDPTAAALPILRAPLDPAAVQTTSLIPDATPRTVGPYTIGLTTAQPLTAGAPLDLRFTITMDGQPVVQLEPLAEPFPPHALCLLIDQDARSLVIARPIDAAAVPGPEHIHHEHHPPEMDMTPQPGERPSPGHLFRAFPACPGPHRLWLRFRHCGQDHEAAFVINIRPPPADGDAPAAHPDEPAAR